MYDGLTPRSCPNCAEVVTCPVYGAVYAALTTKEADSMNVARGLTHVATGIATYCTAYTIREREEEDQPDVR